MTIAARWIGWIDAQERGLLDRWAVDDDSTELVRRSWIGMTWCGSAAVTIGAVFVPLLFPGWPRSASVLSGVTLTASHLAVQCIKRCVARERPAVTPVIPCPDRFSFPSGHAAASLAIALSYAIIWPAIAVPLVLFGMVVGWSRVALGVHYPLDVVVGQLLAVGAAVGYCALR